MTFYCESSPNTSVGVSDYEQKESGDETKNRRHGERLEEAGRGLESFKRAFSKIIEAFGNFLFWKKQMCGFILGKE